MHNCQNFELMFENFCIILREYSQIYSTLELCIVFRIVTLSLNKASISILLDLKNSFCHNDSVPTLNEQIARYC